MVDELVELHGSAAEVRLFEHHFCTIPDLDRCDQMVDQELRFLFCNLAKLISHRTYSGSGYSVLLEIDSVNVSYVLDVLHHLIDLFLVD